MVNFVCIVFELGVKMLTLTSKEKTNRGVQPRSVTWIIVIGLTDRPYMTIVVIQHRQFGYRHLFQCLTVSHHVQFLHLITDERPILLEFRSILVHQIHILSFSLQII